MTPIEARRESIRLLERKRDSEFRAATLCYHMIAPHLEKGSRASPVSIYRSMHPYDARRIPVQRKLEEGGLREELQEVIKADEEWAAMIREKEGLQRLPGAQDSVGLI